MEQARKEAEDTAKTLFLPKVVEVVALDEPVRDVSVVDVGAVGIEVDANIVIEAVVPAEKGSKVGVGVDATVVIGPVVVIGFDSVVQVS